MRGESEGRDGRGASDASTSETERASAREADAGEGESEGTDAGGSDAGEGADTVVVKIGGARAVDPEGALADVADLVADGTRVVVVHGGSTAVDDTLDALGEEPRYVESPSGVVGRYTDERTMEVFSMVLPGKLNTELVAGLRATGVDAVGLSGVDGGLLTGPRKSAIRAVEDGKRKILRGEHSGRIESVNADLLDVLLDAGHTPVVTVPMLGDDGTPVNADADRAAAAVAGALGATLVVLTDVAGVYADPDDPGTLIDRVETPADWTALEAAAEGFMTKKVMAAREALDGGAAAVIVAGANVDGPIAAALSGAGTRIAASAVADGDADSDAETETEAETDTETESETEAT